MFFKRTEYETNFLFYYYITLVKYGFSAKSWVNAVHICPTRMLSKRQRKPKNHPCARRAFDPDSIAPLPGSERQTSQDPRTNRSSTPILERAI